MIEEDGVVFGVRFDDEWQAVLDSSETKDGISAFRGSKYMQARIGDGYICCKKYLQEGCKVLFTDTPCQITGLNRYLREDYPNLITCDVIYPLLVPKSLFSKILLGCYFAGSL